MFRRWMTAAIALLLLVSSSAMPAAAATEPTQQPPTAGGASQATVNPYLIPPQLPIPTQVPLFTDLPQDHWVQPAVVALMKENVVAFKPGAQFRPDDPITRAELVKMVLTARKIDTAGKCSAMFFDVDCSAWYAPYAETAYRMAIAEGIGDRLFQPEAQVTREQLVTIIVRGLGKRWAATKLPWQDVSATLAPFADRGEVSGFARPYLAYAISAHLMSGRPDGTLRPQAIATRAEAAALVSRILLPADGLQTITLDGHTVRYTQSFDLIASKYTPNEHDVGNITYTGVTVRTGTVAVDPNVIPLGSLLYVENYGFAIAADIGGAIKGNRIDLFSWESGSQALHFGLQPVKVWLLP